LNCFKDDQLVICSDGLSTKVTPNEIMTLTGAHPPASSCRAMVTLANERGGDDNISAIVLRIAGVRRQRVSVFRNLINRMKQRMASI
jgi:protein phosphatase